VEILPELIQVIINPAMVVKRQNIFVFSKACPEPVERFRLALSFTFKEDDERI
jgi:hypothetical protein